MKAKQTILVHPALGERTFDHEHAMKLMSMVNNGGWEFKKPSRGVTTPGFSKSADETNPRSDQGTSEVSEEEGSD